MTIPLSASRLHLACAVVAMLALHSCIPEPAYAATPLQLRWTAELSDPKPYNAVLFAGESADLKATLKLYGRAVAIEDSATASLYWQTNGMGSAWWQSAATVTTDGVVSATWTPAMDVGADLYRWHIGVANAASATVYRAFGAFRMQGSPGAAPNVLDLPTRWIDFNAVTVSNAPWATPADVAEATEGMLTTEADPVAGAAISAHAGRTDNPHGVAAAQIGALPVGFPATGTVARASVVGIGDTWVTASNGTATLNHPGREVGVYGGGDSIIVSGATGEGYNGPDPGTVFNFSAYATPVTTYTSGVWRIQINSSVAAVYIDCEPDRRTWYAAGTIPAPGQLDVAPDEFDEAAIGTVSLSWYGLGTVSEQVVTEPTLTDALSGKLDAEDMPGFGYATSNWVESIRGVHADIASNVVYHVVVSNGHWLIQEVQ